MINDYYRHSWTFYYFVFFSASSLDDDAFLLPRCFPPIPLIFSVAVPPLPLYFRLKGKLNRDDDCRHRQTSRVWKTLIDHRWIENIESKSRSPVASLSVDTNSSTFHLTIIGENVSLLQSSCCFICLHFNDNTALSCSLSPNSIRSLSTLCSPSFAIPLEQRQRKKLSANNHIYTIVYRNRFENT